MANTIDQAFIQQFEAEVHLAYQRMGSKLRHTVRVKNGVIGSSTTFQKVGKGAASTKARNAQVPVMNLVHTTAEAELEDWYAGEWVDKLDELKTNIDERQVLADSGAAALGRKTDELIVAELEQATAIIAAGGAGMTEAKVLEAFATINTADVPDDGNRWAIVSPLAWNGLLGLTEFASSDFVGPDELPWRGTQAKRWLGATWMMFTGLPIAANIRSNFMYHRSAIGHAIGADIMTDVTWHGDMAAHFVNNMMSQGSVLIDANGIVEILTDES